MWSLRPEHFKTIRSCLPTSRRTSCHSPLPRPRRRADPALHRGQGAAHRPAGGAAAGTGPSGRHAGLGPQRPAQGFRRGAAGGRTGTLATVPTKASLGYPDGITIGQNYGEDELIERPYLRVANVQSGRLDLSRVTTVRVPTAEINRATLKKGDVLMTEGGDIDKLGRGCVWMGDIPDCLHQNHIFAVRPNPAFLKPAFLVALMESFHGRNYFQVTAKQTTNLAATNRTTLGNFPFYLPSVAEQQDHTAPRCRTTRRARRRYRTYKEPNRPHERVPDPAHRRRGDRPVGRVGGRHRVANAPRGSQPTGEHGYCPGGIRTVNLDRYRKDFDALVKKGAELRNAMMRECDPKEVRPVSSKESLEKNQKK